MLKRDYITDVVVNLLPIDSDMYAKQLEILVGGAMSKLENEGVPNAFSPCDNSALDYCICVAYQVALDLDLDIDIDRMYRQYLTRVNTLRMSIHE